MSYRNKRKLYVAARETARELRSNQTPAEGLFWEAVRNRKCEGMKFQRQYPILHDDTGRETYFVADFCCPALRLVVEIDGGIHDAQEEEDLHREEIIRNSGYQVMRFTNDEIENNLSFVLQRVADAIRSLKPAPHPLSR
jgi:very-short-patch-repair endonuclease